MVKDLDSIGCLTICCIQQFLSIREFKVIFLLPFFRHKCFVWKTVCEMNATEKKPGDYYLYLCELLHEEICWKRGRFVMVWFAGTSATVVSASCADFIVVSFFNNWSCLDIEYKSQFKQTTWEEERIMQQIFLRVLCRLKSVLELLSVAFIITQPMVDLAFVFCFHANIY